jgi:outer membrane lipoprotein-sorting protein
MYRIIPFIFLFTCSLLKAQSGIDLANNMITKIKGLKTLQCTFESQERVLDKTVSEKNNFKINISPFKAYFKQDFPEKGLEGLFISGENSNKTKINPNAFPWMTLNLNPEGDLMMKNHHHPLYHAGYSYVVQVLDMLIKKYQSKTDKLIVNKGVMTYQGQEVYVLDCNNPFYKIQSLNITKAETPYDLGKRLHINYYSILEENPGLKPFSEIPAGKTIKIPSDYASKMTIYLHKTQLYPVYIKISDAKGLFEEYKFTNVILNPSFQASDFSADNPRYNF